MCQGWHLASKHRQAIIKALVGKILNITKKTYISSLFRHKNSKLPNIISTAVNAHQ